MIKRNTDSEESKKFWEYVDKAAKEVDSWPEYKKHSLCKRGDCIFHPKEDCRPNNGLERAIKKAKEYDKDDSN